MYRDGKGHNFSMFNFFKKQVKLTITNKKFAYHIFNTLFTKIKIFIHFILSYAWIHVQKEKILCQTFNTSNVSSNGNFFIKKLSNLGHQK